MLSDSFTTAIDDYIIFPLSCQSHPSGIKSLPTNEDYLFPRQSEKAAEGNLAAINALIKEPVARDQLNEIVDTGSLAMKRPFVPPVELSNDGKNYKGEVEDTAEILNIANPEASSYDKEDSELRNNLIHNLPE